MATTGLMDSISSEEIVDLAFYVDIARSVLEFGLGAADAPSAFPS